MLEVRIQSTNQLPNHLRWLERLKLESEVVASRLSQSRPELSARIFECSDLVYLNICRNGYAVLNKSRLRLCRCRGCPLCERVRHRKQLGRISRGIRLAKKETPTYKWMFLTLPVDAVGVSELREVCLSMGAAIARLSKLKQFKAAGFARLLNIEVLGDRFLPSTTLLMHANPSFFKGRNYLSRDTWQELWEDSLRSSAPPVQVKYMREEGTGKIIYEASRVGRISLANVPDECLTDYLDAVSKLKMMTLSGTCDRLMADRPRPKKSYYPSEKVNLAAMQPAYFANLPNPETEDHGNQYLELFELPFWEEYDESDCQAS